MKPVVKQYLALLLATLLILLACSCRERPKEAVKWTAQRRADTGEVHAVLRVSTIETQPGGRINLELDVESPAGYRIEPSHLHPPGLDIVDFFAEPVRLGKTVNELRRFHWVFQAGAPGGISNQFLHVNFESSTETNGVSVELPHLVIQSAFPPGRFTNALPPLEDPHAL